MRGDIFQRLFSRGRAILVLAFFSLATPMLAQNAAKNGSQSSLPVQASVGINQPSRPAHEDLPEASAESQRSESRIGADDLLNISVFEAPEMNCTVRVSAGGQISLQLLGAVQASGLTARELESSLQDQLRQTYMKDPHVSVFIQELQSHSVSVVGAVKSPGVLQIRGSKTVIEVLSLAGGLADDAGDTVRIMRGAWFTESGYSDGLGPTRTRFAPAPVFHEVFPRAYDSPPATSEKKEETVEINLKRLLESSDSASNVAVLPGDIVKVARAGIVYVVGEVTKPGGFVLQNNENISVLQAIALAQGTTHTSAISQARIIRTDPATGRRTEIPMNLGKILSGKKPDTLLQAKDIVFVPNSTAKSVFYRGSVAALQTATGVAIYRR
jgi:polysaccharide biosynthesis/export protein